MSADPTYSLRFVKRPYIASTVVTAERQRRCYCGAPMVAGICLGDRVDIDIDTEEFQS